MNMSQPLNLFQPIYSLNIVQQLQLGSATKYPQTIYNNLNRDGVFGTFHNLYKGDPNA